MNLETFISEIKMLRKNDPESAIYNTVLSDPVEFFKSPK